MSRGTKAAVARICGLIAAGAAGFICLVLLLYFTTAHMQAATSDSATVVLEGQAIAKGQILLHSWDLTFASYWTSTAAFDAVAIVLNGLRAGLMYAVPAASWSLVSDVVAWRAWPQARPWSYSWPLPRRPWPFSSLATAST
jgi:hypothetical protein